MLCGIEAARDGPDRSPFPVYPMASLYSASLFDVRENVRHPSDQFTEVAYFAPCFWRGLLRLRRLHDAKFASLVDASHLDTFTFSRLSNELLRDYDKSIALLRQRFPSRLVGEAFLMSHT